MLSISILVISGSESVQSTTPDKQVPFAEEPVEVISMKHSLRLKTFVVCITCGLFLCAPGRIPSEEKDAASGEIKALIQKSQSFLDEWKIDQAITAGELALEKAKKKYGEPHETVAEILYILGTCYYRQAHYDKSYAMYRQSLSIRKTILPPDHPDIGESLYGLAMVHEALGKYEDAERFYKQALENREKALGPEHADVASSLNSLAILYKKVGRYQEAETLYRRALEIKRKTWEQMQPAAAKSLNNLAILNWQQAEYMEAEPLFLQAQEIFKKSLGPEHPYLASSLNSLATLYKKLGRYKEAEPLFRQTIAIKKKVLEPEHPSLAASLHNLANLYLEQGKYEEASTRCRQALEIRRKALGPEHPDVAHSLDSLGKIRASQGRYADAEMHYRQALEIRKKTLGADHSDVAESLNHLAMVYCKQGRYRAAESLYQKGLTIRNRALGEEHPYVAESLFNLALLFENLGKTDEIEPHYRAAMKIREAVLGPEHPDTCQCIENLAIFYGTQDRKVESLALFRKLHASRQRFIEYVFSYASEDQKMRYLEKYPLADHAFLSFAAMHLSTGDPAGKEEKYRIFIKDLKRSALEAVLKSKAVVIDAVSAERQIAFDAENINIRQKAEKHAAVSGEISNLTMGGVKNLEPDRYRQRLRTLYRMREALETELSNLCAEFKDDLAARKFEIMDVAEAIPEGGILWEFVRYTPYSFHGSEKPGARTGPDRYLAFTLNHSGEITLTDMGETEKIDGLIRSARREIYRSRSEIYSPGVVAAEERLNKVTRRLYEMVFAPLSSHLGDRTTIFISPDGQLNLIPFEIFPCPDGAYAIEKYKISYLSSGRDLLRFRRNRKAGKWALIMADPDFDFSPDAPASHDLSRGSGRCPDKPFRPLRYGIREAEAVKDTMKTPPSLKTRCYYGDQAREEILKGMSTAPEIVHLVTHGFFCGDVASGPAALMENPLLRSGLAFAGANRLMADIPEELQGREDGILTAFEASGLNLVKTDLVTLSACETGVGEVKNGEGVYGLRRAFQHAGARTIIMSLWKVPDRETFDLMRVFYESRAAGMAKRAALRHSALKVLRSKREQYNAAHPLLWGAFVLLGDPD